MKLKILVAAGLVLVGCSSGGGDGSGSSSSSGSSTGATSSSGSTTSSGTGSSGGTGSTGEVLPRSPAITSFTATPSGLPPGGGTVTLGWTVDGAQTLDLEPGSIDVTGLDTIDIPNVTAATTFRLLATNSAGTSVARASVTVATPGNVHGVVQHLDGTPAVYQRLFVEGHLAVLSGLDGTFTIPGVVPPYTLVVVTDDGQHVEVFTELSDLNPVVPVHSEGDENPESSWVDVSGPLLGANPDAGVFIQGASATSNNESSASSTDYTTSLWVSDQDGGSPGLIIATQGEALDDGGFEYTMFGSTAITFADMSAVDAGITLVPTSSVSVPVTLSDLDPVANNSLAVGLRTDGVQPVFFQSLDLDSSASTYDLTLPLAPALQPMLSVESDYDSAFDCAAYVTAYGTTSGGFNVAMPRPPFIASPIPEAANPSPAGLSVTWLAVPGADTGYALWVGTGPIEVTVFTRDTHVQLPDLSALGVQLEPGDYSMEVDSSSQFANLLDFARWNLSWWEGDTLPLDGQRFGYCYQEFQVGGLDN